MLKSIILLLISTAGFAQQRLHSVYRNSPKPDISIICFTPDNYPQVSRDWTTTGVTIRTICLNSHAIYKEPFYVIDGKPLIKKRHIIGNPVNSISPESIESIDVLKAEEAIALFGPEASEGAILITTKSSKQSGKKKALNNTP